MSYNSLEKFSNFGVLPREAVRNDASALRFLLRNDFVHKVYQKGRVYYELTAKALPLLEDYRQILLHQASLHYRLTPQSQFYRALLGDLRFLNEQHPLAEAYRLLGDWHLTRPVVASQLKLSQMRYYRNQGVHGC